MRLGMFMMPVHPPDRTFWGTLDEDTEKSLLADQLGFDELWLGEHFSASTEPIPSPLMFFADLLHRTKHITFGTAVINIPNHHPAIVAAECAQFDHMSRGRFMLGVGPGGLISDFELFKLTDHGARNRMVVEAVDMIRRDLVAGPALRAQGRVLGYLDQGRHQRQARRRLHAKALSAARGPAGVHLAGKPELVVGENRGGKRLGHDLRQYHPDLLGRVALDGLQRRLPGAGQETERRELARGAQRDGGASPTPRRKTACSAQRPRTIISTPTCARC